MAFFVAVALILARSITRHLAMKMTSRPGRDEWEISPFFRVLAAVSLLAFSYIIWDISTAHLAVAEGVSPADCDKQRRIIGELVCDISNSFLSSFSKNLQGPADGAAGILLILFLLYVIWLLLKPVFTRKRKE